MNIIKRIAALITLPLLLAAPLSAGGLVTNTNNMAFFHRMLARGASTDIDAVYTNPAGLSWLSRDGFSLALSYQSVWQGRDIVADYTAYPDRKIRKVYKGTANAPVVPSVFAVYKKGSWAFSGGLFIVGGGGKCVFDGGIPMLESVVQAQVYAKTSGAIQSGMMDVSSSLEGRAYNYALQMGATYRFSDHLSGYLGGRLTYNFGGVRGSLNASLKEEYLPLGQKMGLQDGQIARLGVDCAYSAWGLNPVVGLDAKFGKLLLAARYEFKTVYRMKNRTKENSDPQGVLAQYRDGATFRDDMPALATFYLGYSFTPWLRAQGGCHYYFDKDCQMAGGKQKSLTHNTYELLLGVEADVTSRILLSTGFQVTDYGLSNGLQSDASFFCDAVSIGFGGAYRFTEKLRLNAGYFFSIYKDYRKQSDSFNSTGLSGLSIYDRSNRVLGLTLDYTF